MATVGGDTCVMGDNADIGLSIAGRQLDQVIMDVDVIIEFGLQSLGSIMQTR